MGAVSRVAEPKRPPTWLLGSTHGIQVWTVDDPHLCVSVFISNEPPVILLGAHIADTPAEGEALTWAFAEIASGARGFAVRIMP